MELNALSSETLKWCGDALLNGDMLPLVWHHNTIAFKIAHDMAATCSLPDRL